MGSALSTWVLTSMGRGRRATPSGSALDMSFVTRLGPPRRPLLAADNWLASWCLGMMFWILGAGRVVLARSL
eukprot:4815426-Pyramimonas_sp.AAC.1